MTHARAPRRWCCGVCRTGAGATTATATTTAHDDAAHVADHHRVLAALVIAQLPAEQRVVERGLFLVVRRLERNVIEIHRLPVGGLERRRRADFPVRRALAPVLPVAVADAQIETIGVLDAEAFESAGTVVCNRI